MNCPFPLPIRFESKKSFERHLKKAGPAIQNEVSEVVDCFVSGNIPEKYRPRKIQPYHRQEYRIRISDHRLVYILEEKENDEHVGVLIALLPRPQSYRRSD